MSTSNTTPSDSEIFKNADPTQIELMNEKCLLLDEQDKVIGHASKKDSHLMVNINKGMLHRAFSVFLFSSDGKLLLQKRASEKITYPDHQTNSCCSHPLYFEKVNDSSASANADQPEMEEKDQLGVRRAARRKLEHELGIAQSAFDLDDFVFLTRVHYKAPSDEIWGEHEIDYILIVQKDVELKPNPNEVSETRYVTRDQLKALIEQSKQSDDVKITPWFALICENFLYKWWDHLDDLSSQKDHSTIHKYI
mmetsp:Transcript_464/g.626  ORF Transcript_464/g.626 Transcript_464/m.626 type:complete len:251 (-) Transcript_464:60-812(-)